MKDQEMYMPHVPSGSMKGMTPGLLAVSEMCKPTLVFLKCYLLGAVKHFARL